ncbi:MAG: hypothetical protein GKC04_01415 [Methanomicrobiales archaeon]|nr:hypothetical protein [Methanomicrobiales archaeon]
MNERSMQTFARSHPELIARLQVIVLAIQIAATVSLGVGAVAALVLILTSV